MANGNNNNNSNINSNEYCNFFSSFCLCFGLFRQVIFLSIFFFFLLPGVIFQIPACLSARFAAAFDNLLIKFVWPQTQACHSPALSVSLWGRGCLSICVCVCVFFLGHPHQHRQILVGIFKRFKWQIIPWDLLANLFLNIWLWQQPKASLPWCALRSFLTNYRRKAYCPPTPSPATVAANVVQMDLNYLPLLAFLDPFRPTPTSPFK